MDTTPRFHKNQWVNAGAFLIRPEVDRSGDAFVVLRGNKHIARNWGELKRKAHCSIVRELAIIRTRNKTNKEIGIVWSKVKEFLKSGDVNRSSDLSMTMLALWRSDIGQADLSEEDIAFIGRHLQEYLDQDCVVLADEIRDEAEVLASKPIFGMF